MVRQPRSTNGTPQSLVARDRELRLFEDLLDQAIEGRGSVALISGEAGIGKTALAEAVAQRAAGRDMLVLTGACYDLTVTPAYGPWREMVGRYQRLVGQGDELPPAPDFLRDRQSSDAARDQAALFDQVLTFLDELSRSRPLLLVFDDMHWSDPASLDLLRVVARRVIDLPVLALVTYRMPSEDVESSIERLVPLLVREAGTERIGLGPLDRPALELLVSQRYTMDDDHRRRLLEYLESYAQGNPFFVLELLRSLEEDLRLTTSDGGWVVGDLVRAPVPTLLREMIESRLERLPDAVRWRLLVAAVIGQEVRLDAWQRVLGIAEAEMIETVDVLAGAGLVRPSPDGESMRFSHAMIHEVLYEATLSPRRRKLHREIAEMLEISDEPDPDLVAWHFQQAADPRATDWLIRAADRAQRAYAWTTAAGRLVQADKLLADEQDGDQRGWLRYRIGRLRRHADPIDAGRWLERAERLGIVADDPALVAFARFDRGHIEVLQGDYRQGLQRMIEANRRLSALDAGRFTGEVAARVSDAVPEVALPAGGDQVPPVENPADVRRGTLVQWLVEAGRFEEAVALGRPFVDRLGDLTVLDDQRTSSLGDAWFGLGRIAAQRGEPDEAMDALGRALDCYRRIDHHLLMASTLRVQLAEALLPFRTEDVEGQRRVIREAERAYRRASGAADDALAAGFASLERWYLDGRWPKAVEILTAMVDQPGGIVVWRHRAATLLARLAFERGDPEAARKHIESILPDGAGTEPGSTTYIRAIDLQLLAVEIALDDGDLDRALDWLDAVDRWLDWSGAARGRVESMVARAYYLAATGDPTAALELATNAVERACEPRQPLALLSALRCAGEFMAATGRQEATDHLERALEIAESCEASFEVARTKLALAQLEATTDNGDRASDLLDEARDVLEELGARRALARLDELSARLADGLDSRETPFGLSAREMEVLGLVAAGLTDAEVAGELHISYRTVTTHLTSIFTKLGVNSRVSATRIAVEHDLT